MHDQTYRALSSSQILICNNSAAGNREIKKQREKWRQHLNSATRGVVATARRQMDNGPLACFLLVHTLEVALIPFSLLFPPLFQPRNVCLYSSVWYSNTLPCSVKLSCLSFSLPSPVRRTTHGTPPYLLSEGRPNLRVATATKRGERKR